MKKSAKELNQMTPEELGMLFPIFLTEPDPRWAFRYSREKKRIEKALDPAFIKAIEHIGSTSVPGLISKPTIDILLEIAENSDKQEFIDIMIRNGYQLIPKPENPPPHMMFVKGYTKKGFRGQAFHIHVRYPGDWDELHFRNYLREHPETAMDYAKLKTELAVEYRNDRDGYTDAKTKFVQEINRMAREESRSRKG
jgi:GrpB-like predicted nucleotidyltransferase (UPF0157 family)